MTIDFDGIMKQQKKDAIQERKSAQNFTLNNTYSLPFQKQPNHFDHSLSKCFAPGGSPVWKLSTQTVKVCEEINFKNPIYSNL